MVLKLAWRGRRPGFVGVVGMLIVLCALFIVVKVALRDADPLAALRSDGVDVEPGDVVDVRPDGLVVVTRPPAEVPDLLREPLPNPPWAPAAAVPDEPAAKCCVDMEGTWIRSHAGCAFELSAATREQIARIRTHGRPMPVTAISQRRLQWALGRSARLEGMERSTLERAVGLDALPARLPPSRAAVEDVDAHLSAPDWTPDQQTELQRCMRDLGADALALQAARPVAEDALRALPAADGPRVGIERKGASLMKYRTALCCAQAEGKVRQGRCTRQRPEVFERCLERIPSFPAVPPMPTAPFFSLSVGRVWRTPSRAFLYDGSAAAEITFSGAVPQWSGQPIAPLTVRTAQPFEILTEVHSRALMACLTVDASREVLEEEDIQRCRVEASTLADLSHRIERRLSEAAVSLATCCQLANEEPRPPFPVRPIPCIGELCPLVTPCQARTPEIFRRCIDGRR